MKYNKYILSILSVILITFYANSQAINHDVKIGSNQTPKIIENKLIIAFNQAIPINMQAESVQNVFQNDISRLFSSVGVTSYELIGSRKHLDKMKVLKKNMPLLLTLDGTIKTKEAQSILKQLSNVKYVEFDSYAFVSGNCSYTPNDPYFAHHQWAMENNGTFLSGAVVDADIDMTGAWGVTKGDASVVITIIDTGIKLDHPEFSGRLWVNSGEIAGNGIDDDGNGFVDDINGWDYGDSNNIPMDQNGHGTNVTGIAAATGDNGNGYAGIDWNAKIMPLKVSNSAGSITDAWWVAAIYYAVDHGADVINISLYSWYHAQYKLDAVNYAYDNGVTIVTGIGNFNNNTALYPTSYENVISVGAISYDNNRAVPFTGAPSTSGSSYGTHIDLVAPGDKIYGLKYNSNTYGWYYSGTSMSSPMVAGVISLMKGIRPDLNPKEIKEIIERTAIDQVGDIAEDTPGWDQYYGNGLLNAEKAIMELFTVRDTVTMCFGAHFVNALNDTIVNVPASGNDTVTLISSYNCDSLIITKINELPNPGINNLATIELCSGESYTYPDGTNSTNILADESYLSTLSSTLTGCDSLVHTSIVILPILSSTENLYICNGQNYMLPNGDTLFQLATDTTFTTTYVSTSTGCDSLVTSHVSIQSMAVSFDTTKVCVGANYTFPDGSMHLDIQTNLEHLSHLTTTFGCDSFINTYVDVTKINVALVANDSGLIAFHESTNSYQWFDCNDNFQPISEETDSLFEASNSGNFAVEIYRDGCIDTSLCMDYFIASVETSDANKANIYPNPFVHDFYIEMEQSSAYLKIELVNVLGETMYFNKDFQSKLIHLNPNIPAGFYFVRLFHRSGDVENIKVYKRG